MVFKSGKEHNTLEMYRNAIRVHIVPSIGHIRLKDLKPHHVQEMINIKSSEGLTKTLLVIKSTLGQILEQAVKNEFIYKNVIHSVNFPTVPKPKKRSLTEDEKSYVAIAYLDLKCKAFVYVLLYTGLRRGEALSLTKSDIDLKEKALTVNKNLIFVGNKGEIKPTPKTDAGNRTIPIPSILLDVLREYLPIVQSIHLFPSTQNVLMSESAYRCFWNKILNRLNIAAGGKTKGKLKLIAVADDVTRTFSDTPMQRHYIMLG